MSGFNEILKNIKFKIINIRFFSSKNKIKLDKNSNNNNCIIKYSHKLIRAKENKNIETLSEEIKDFLTVMERDCKNFDSKLFIKNFKKTLFDIRKIDENKKDYGGVVRYHKLTRKSSLTIDSFKVIKHELLHLSTQRKDDCGFKVNFKCRQLNEGYTQLLAERYFKENIGAGLIFEVVFARIIENLIGQDQMEKYYFNLDLHSLINDLNKYETMENITNFINDLDELMMNDIYYIDEPTKKQIETFQNIINKICNFLFSCIKNKTIALLSSNSIMEADNFIKKLIVPTFIEKHDYRINMFDDNKMKNIDALLHLKIADNFWQSSIDHKKRK